MSSQGLLKNLDGGRGNVRKITVAGFSKVRLSVMMMRYLFPLPEVFHHASTTSKPFTLLARVYM